MDFRSYKYVKQAGKKEWRKEKGTDMKEKSEQKRSLAISYRRNTTNTNKILYIFSYIL